VRVCGLFRTAALSTAERVGGEQMKIEIKRVEEIKATRVHVDDSPN